jgi:AraC-like DNA-binding protein
MAVIACVNYSEPAIKRLQGALGRATVQARHVDKPLERKSDVASVYLVHCETGSESDLQLAKQLKRRAPSIPLILTSDKADAHIAIVALRLGARNLFVLPAEHYHLVFSIREWVRRYAARQCESRDAVFREPVVDYTPDHLEQSHEKSRISAAVDIVHRRYMEKVSVEEIASQCCMSADTLRRHFHRAFGASVREYTKRYRVQRAAELLLYNDLPVMQVAGQVGYNDISLFCRIFKQEMKMTPGEYRKQRTSAS